MAGGGVGEEGVDLEERHLLEADVDDADLVSHERGKIRLAGARLADHQEAIGPARGA